MTSWENTKIEALIRSATNQALELILRDGCPLVIVDSPPGAGKTWLVETIAALAAHYGLRVGVIAPRAQQTYELVERLVRDFAPDRVQLLKSEDRDLPPGLVVNPHILPPMSHVRDLFQGPGIVIGTAAKFFLSTPAFDDRHFDLLICDEAYQLAYKDLAPLFRITKQTLLVGDPGQLLPLITADIARFEAAPYKVHWPVPRAMLRQFPETPVVRLPATRRLLQDTVTLVQPSLYSDLPFSSAVNPATRQLRFSTGGMNSPVDRALDMLSMGKSIVGVLLPQSEFLIDDVDEELSELISTIVQRFFERGAQWEGVGNLASTNIGCVDSHVNSAAATSRHLGIGGISTNELMVNTPEVWQGSQRAIMIIKNPLSGKRRLTSFDLDPGRLCVMLSRHEIGCIVVGRDGFLDALGSHQHNCADRPMGANDVEWTGWQAYNNLWAELERMGRLVRL